MHRAILALAARARERGAGTFLLFVAAQMLVVVGMPLLALGFAPRHAGFIAVTMATGTMLLVLEWGLV